MPQPALSSLAETLNFHLMRFKLASTVEPIWACGRAKRMRPAIVRALYHLLDDEK
jgi:hypothetical protein